MLSVAYYFNQETLSSNDYQPTPWKFPLMTALKDNFDRPHWSWLQDLFWPRKVEFLRKVYQRFWKSYCKMSAILGNDCPININCSTGLKFASLPAIVSAINIFLSFRYSYSQSVFFNILNKNKTLLFLISKLHF